MPHVITLILLAVPSILGIRLVSRVAYDGTHFNGWQLQPQVRTVQGVLSKTIAQRLSLTDSTGIKVVGASRTDVGVHASGQVMHVDVPEEASQALSEFSRLEFSINMMLPRDVRIYNLSYAPLGSNEQVSAGKCFHSCSSAIGKRYVYKYCTAPIMDPLRRLYYGHYAHSINWKLFDECLEQFVGEHDFSAFANRLERASLAGRQAGFEVTPFRTIKQIRRIDEGDEYGRIEIDLSSALYKMVRNIIGTAFDVGGGAMSADLVTRLLASGAPRNDNPAKPAPPQGLHLHTVYYDHY